LLVNQLGVLSISVKFTKPSDFPCTLLLSSLLRAKFGVKMEHLGLVTRRDLHLIIRCEDLIRNWSPAVVLDAMVPTFKVVFLRLVKRNIDRGLLLFFLHLHVVTWSEGIDVN